MLDSHLSSSSARMLARNHHRSPATGARAVTTSVTPTARQAETSCQPLPPRNHRQLTGPMREPAWANAAQITGFRMFQPVEDGEPRFRTEAKVVYDAANFYIFVRAFDPRPDSIIGLLSRRDVKTESDQIKVMIDSYHDRRTGYEFAVNPVGVKRDYYAYDDSREDASWDAVWDVATRIDSLGWTAEFRIPLSQLRFPRSESNHIRLHDHARRRAHERADELAASSLHETGVFHRSSERSASCAASALRGGWR